MSASPMAYDAAVERIDPGETEAIASINRRMRGILDTTWADYGHSVRSVHAKSHGLLQGTLQVLDGLPDSLAQGVFERPGAFPVVMRFSTNPGDILDDTVSSPRGLAIKLIGVQGERLPGSEADTTQDFVMVNGPAFVAPNAQKFNRSLGLLAATTDTGQGWKKALSKVLRGAVKLLSAAGSEASALKSLGGQPLTHPLGETFYSQTPFRYGSAIAKLSVAPISPELRALTDAPVNLSGRPNGLRAALIDYFGVHGGEWELRVQLRTNADTMPVEDASVAWPEDESPYVPVARITAARQPAWNEERAEQVDDGLSFSPWRGITAHQPLGSVNRARKDAYAMSAGFRATHNHCPMHEPRGALELTGQAPSVYGRAPGREGHRPNTPDALPGMLGQPLNTTAKAVVAGAVGGLTAGALLSAIFLGMEALTYEPSDLVKLKRRSSRVLGRVDAWDRARPDSGDQMLSHGGHLALSLAAGAAYGVAKPAWASPLAAGAVFGAGFYALAYGVLGPVLQVSPPLTRDTPSSVAQHGMFHLLFGATTALVADRVARRI